MVKPPARYKGRAVMGGMREWVAGRWKNLPLAGRLGVWPPAHNGHYEKDKS